MYYVSGKQVVNGQEMYNITDTSDGVSELYTKSQIHDMVKTIKGLKIEGVSKTGIKVVNASQNIIQSNVDAFANIVRNSVFNFSLDECEQLAGSVHFKRQIKGVDDINQIRQITYQNIYPESVQEVVRTASEYTNTIHEVDVTNPNQIKQALKSGVCLVLQHKTNGALTAFICTANIQIMDKLYEPMFVDRMFLTKTLYDYVKIAEKIKDKDREVKSNPEMLNVFSASLRFRKTGVKHDGLEKEISSIFYSVNIPKVLAMFVLDNPTTMGDTIMTEFRTKLAGSNSQTEVQGYNFNMKIYNGVCQSLQQGRDLFGENPNVVGDLIAERGITDRVDLTTIVKKYQDKYGYMSWLRKNCISFKE